MASVKEDNKFVLLTHNIHFYLNVKYGVGYKKNSFVRLTFSGKNIVLKFIGCEEDDFKTSYEALWKDLEIMYGCPVLSDSMLLNQIRRIIDTFTQFNCIDPKDMLANVSGAKKCLM